MLSGACRYGCFLEISSLLSEAHGRGGFCIVFLNLALKTSYAALQVIRYYFGSHFHSIIGSNS